MTLPPLAPFRALSIVTLSIVVIAVGLLVVSGSALAVGAAGATVGTHTSSARPRVATTSDWTTFDQNPLRTGVDASGSSFATANPAWTTPDLDGQITVSHSSMPDGSSLPPRTIRSTPWPPTRVLSCGHTTWLHLSPPATSLVLTSAPRSASPDRRSSTPLAQRSSWWPTRTPPRDRPTT